MQIMDRHAITGHCTVYKKWCYIGNNITAGYIKSRISDNFKFGLKYFRIRIRDKISGKNIL